MAYLTKAEALLKLAPFGVKSLSGLNRLIRDQELPAKYLSPRKVFFDENDIDIWLGRRHKVVAKANATQVKVIEYQRKKRRKEKEDAELGGGVAEITLSTKHKQTEAKPIMAKEA